ncbi:Retrovirus-related Pol polyprotein from transposon TNT 1-94-like protein [Drosera capensis]
MVCKLKKSIYGLKQASRQWYHKFHNVIISFDLEPNIADDCIYHKFSGSKYIEIASKVFSDSHKRAISIRFLRDMACGIVNQVTPLLLRKTNLVSISAPKNGFETKEIEKTPYVLAVGSLMYAQISQQSGNRPLEGSQKGHAILTKNKRLHAHISEVGSA